MPITFPISELPVYVDKNRSLRVKIIDSCGMTCVFCHNEGTPVVADNLKRIRGDWIDAGPSGRKSIYAKTNGVRFLPGTVEPNEEFANVLKMLRKSLQVNELHLTGGEPTLHPELPEIIRLARSVGYQVCMTSNGENGARVLLDCAVAGLDRVNFSIFGTTAEELAQVQHEKYRNPVLAERKISALKDSIQMAIRSGVKVSANIVVPDYRHAPRVYRLLDEYSPSLSVRLLNSLDDGQPSIDAIHQILNDLNAVPIAKYVTAGVSGCRTAYRLPSGRILYFKEIRPVRLPTTCSNCRFNNDTDCQEGYYGVRLYRDRSGGYQVGVCIQRMDLCMPVENFVKSSVRDEIIALREKEYHQFLAQKWRSVIMATEYEGKILEINPSEMEDKILSRGGEKVGEALMRRYVYDITPGNKSKWIRLRDTGKEITLTIKEIHHDGIDGTEETEISVDSFETANKMLEKLGYKAKGYQENRRTSFILDGARLEIDEWPMIPPYLEIEANSREEVIKIASLLGFDDAQLTGENTIKIYAKYGIDLNEIKDLRFTENDVKMI
ncbi:radical SAM protein [Thermoactinomyces daqus]|nr:radical SAM protein [Thermoactinomyces daqus]